MNKATFLALILMASPAIADTTLVAEPQDPTGKFTTATEVKPIMQATRSAWVALREYEGQDWLYVTQILSWRCGLVQLKLGVNGDEPAVWPMPPCHTDTAQPNAMTESDFQLQPNIYKVYPLSSVNSISVEITYDDLTTDSHTWERKAVLMP